MRISELKHLVEKGPLWIGLAKMIASGEAQMPSDLQEAIDRGLIELDFDSGFKATKRGRQFVALISKCPTCGRPRKVEWV